MIVLWLGLGLLAAHAQVDTSRLNADPSGAGDAPNAAFSAASSNAAPVSATEPAETNAPATPDASPAITTALPVAVFPAVNVARLFAAWAGFLSIAGFLLYFCGLTRARNTSHTATLILVAVVFALLGYAVAGFAVQSGGLADTHATMAALPIGTGLDHELGFMSEGHYWGVMGNAGFFLASEPSAAATTALLFLGQAALLVIAVLAALGTALERVRLVAAAAATFLIGALIYPLYANWVWGGGWLAELGRAFSLGHGVIDWGGASVVHETAGTLALVFALLLGARYGRFNREKISRPMPGHHVPYTILGVVVLLLSWMGATGHPGGELAALNLLLAAIAGLAMTFLLNSGTRRPEPARLCRGLLGGAIASTGAGPHLDPWAALVSGAIAALLVQGATSFLEKRRLDDPAGVVAVHGIGGAWGMLVTGLFANGLAEGVRGLFYGGGWGQLAAQTIGTAVCFVTVFGLGFIGLGLIHKIIGTRVEVQDEVEGLDWPQTGALGYQADAEPESLPPQS